MEVQSKKRCQIKQCFEPLGQTTCNKFKNTDHHLLLVYVNLYRPSSSDPLGNFHTTSATAMDLMERQYF